MSIVQDKRDEMMNNVTKETAMHAAKSERATASGRRISEQIANKASMRGN